MSTIPWVILRLRSWPGATPVLLEYSDFRGRGFGCTVVPGQECPKTIKDHISELSGFGQIAIFLDPEMPRRVAVAPSVYKRFAREATSITRLAVLSELAQSVRNLGAQVQTVYLAPGPLPERSPFELPLNVLTVGAATTWLRDAIASRQWLEQIRGEYDGLAATGNWIRELLKRRWRGTETDMMICAAADVRRLSAALRAVRYQPRLLVGLTDAVSWEGQLRFAPHNLPVGTSLLVVAFGGRLGSESKAIVELMRDFAHDLPLHEFGRRVDRDDCDRGRPSILFSRPEALDAMRLSYALPDINEEILSLSSTATPAGVEKLFSMPQMAPLRLALRADQPPSTRVVLSSGLGSAFFDRAITQVEDFTHEGEGLLPMASIRRLLQIEREADAKARSTIADALQDPELRDTYIRQQARTVDVTMRRLSRDGRAGPFVKPHDTLVAQMRYRVRVQVGRRSAVSIVSGDVPPIDLLLPPPEKGRHHVLHVALYTDDFDLSSPVMQRLELPEVGPSPALHFDVVPRSGVRNAQARIAVYYDLPPEISDGEMRNHLVQTFLLTAPVSDSEDQLASGEGIKVTLEFSLNANFNQLEHLESRLVSLALNDGPTPASHKLMMKRGGDALPVNFTEAQIGASLKGIRDTFEWASRNDAQNGPRFPADQVEGAAADFDQVIWRLAASGHSLNDELFGAALGTPLEGALNAAAQDRNRLIQAVHLARNFAFPWTAIYDFDLPPTVVGGAVPTICKDFRRKHPDGTTYSCAECLDHCTYPDKRQAVCVYGFWGTRQQVEQLIVDTTEKPRDLHPIGPGAVAFTMGLTGRFVQEIPNDLTQKLGAFARQVSDDEDFLPTLWSDHRPAILLLVGHYRTKDVTGEPAGPRLTLPGQRFLKPDDIFRQRKSHPENWTDPRTVILLAACSGGVVDITSVLNFVNIFTGVGAGAVIGPEAIIYEGVARRFAVEVSEALVAGKSVGVAILEFRRRLLQNLNPLGLLFTAYGFADLATPTTHGPGWLS
jgi:hypothetical protein